MRPVFATLAALLLAACQPDEDPWDEPGDPNEIDCVTAPHQDKCRRDGGRRAVPSEGEGENEIPDGPAA